MSKAKRKEARRRRQRERGATASGPLYIDSRLFAEQGLVQMREPDLKPGVMCVPNRPQSDEEWAEIREFAQFVQDMESQQQA